MMLPESDSSVLCHSDKSAVIPGPVAIGNMAPMVWRVEEILFDGRDCNMNHSSVDAEASFAWD